MLDTMPEGIFERAIEYRALLDRLISSLASDEEARRRLTNEIRDNQRRATALFAVKA